MTSLAEKVKAFRLAKGLHARQMATNLGVADSLIGDLESGRRQYLTRHDVERLARALDVPERELWELIPGWDTEASRRRGFRSAPIISAPNDRRFCDR